MNRKKRETRTDHAALRHARSASAADVPAPSRLGRRALLVRADIIGSAVKSFAEKGFVGTTMEDVARAAGFAPSSLYGYFAGKDELYIATLEMIATRVVGAFDDPLVHELATTDRVLWILRRVCQIIEPNRELFVLLFGHAPFIEWTASQSVGAGAVGKRAYLQVIQRLADEIEAGHPKRSLAKRDALDLAYVIAGAFQSWVFRWIHGDMSEGLQPSLARLFAHIRPLLETA